MEKGKFLINRQEGRGGDTISFTIIPSEHKLEFLEKVVAYQLAKPIPPIIKMIPRKEIGNATKKEVLPADLLRAKKSLEGEDRFAFIHQIAKMFKESFAVTFIHSVEDILPNPTTPFEKFINTLKELDAI